MIPCMLPKLAVSKKTRMDDESPKLWLHDLIECVEGVATTAEVLAGKSVADDVAIQAETHH